MDKFYAGGNVPSELVGHSRPAFHRYFGEQENFVEGQRKMSDGTWPLDHLRFRLDEA